MQLSYFEFQFHCRQLTRRTIKGTLSGGKIANYSSKPAVRKIPGAASCPARPAGFDAVETGSVAIPNRDVFTVIYTQTSERGFGVSLGAQLRARLIGAMEYVEQVLE